MSKKRTLQSALVLIPFLALAACQAPVGTTSPSPSRPGASASSIPISSSAPPTSQNGFDAAHVNDLVGPAVAEIMVTVSGGIQQGSGFVVQVDGSTSYILTNNHVVTGGRQVQVLMPDGRHYVAQVQGADAIEDLAVIKVSDKLPLAQFGDSGKARVGEPVVAIGTPLGQAGSVTAGTGQGGNSENLPDVIQTDAAINPGNSGGPLADGNGLVIGVNTAGNSQASGIGFAIPSLVARRIASALIAGQKPGHPYLGVQYQDLSTALQSGQSVNGFGVVIACTVPDSPAAKGGIKGGDVIEKIDGTDLNNGETLGGLLQIHNPGDQVPMTVLRNGSTQNLTVTLGDRPAQIQSCSP